MNNEPAHDVMVIGGGPAGATAARMLAQEGFRVVVLERDTHPRFHIGESFLPRNYQLLAELGLMESFEALDHTVKLGAGFAMGHGRDPVSRFRFASMLGDQEHRAFNIERAPFDKMLLDAASAAGAQVRQNTMVRRIAELADGHVQVELPDGPLRARWLIDASGQTAVVGRHLKIRRVLAHHQKVAYFGHFTGVDRDAGEEGGSPLFAVCAEGWMWMIPLDATRTSIGLVMDAQVARSIDHPADQMLRWAIERCPFVRERTRHAVFPQRNEIGADFSYRCDPCAGPGYFMTGDAGAFVDPIFSTGVCLGMMSAIEAARAITAIMRHGASPARQRQRYIRYVKGSSAVFFRMVDLYYDHAFRELFLHGTGPWQMHKAVISLLAGHVFPRASLAVRWRIKLFELFVRLQRHIALAPHREPFSLLDGPQTVLPTEGRVYEPACT